MVGHLGFGDRIGRVTVGFGNGAVGGSLWHLRDRTGDHWGFEGEDWRRHCGVGDNDMEVDHWEFGDRPEVGERDRPWRTPGVPPVTHRLGRVSYHLGGVPAPPSPRSPPGQPADSFGRLLASGTGRRRSLRTGRGWLRGTGTRERGCAPPQAVCPPSGHLGSARCRGAGRCGHTGGPRTAPAAPPAPPPQCRTTDSLGGVQIMKSCGGCVVPPHLLLGAPPSMGGGPGPPGTQHSPDEDGPALTHVRGGLWLPPPRLLSGGDSPCK